MMKVLQIRVARALWLVSDRCNRLAIRIFVQAGRR
jgi:hypothetical protein